MTRPVVDSRFLTEMADYFPSLCTIQEDLGVKDAHGVRVPAWTNVVGLVAIPCAVAATGGQEVKLPDQTYVVANFKIALRGSYTITEKQRTVVTGPNAGTYDILLVEGSSHARATRLMVNEVS